MEGLRIEVEGLRSKVEGLRIEVEEFRRKVEEFRGTIGLHNILKNMSYYAPFIQSARLRWKDCADLFVLRKA